MGIAYNGNGQGGQVERVVYDASNPLTWNIQQQDANVTIQTSYPVTITSFSDEGALATGDVDTTETVDLTSVDKIYVDYTKNIINQQAGVNANDANHELLLDSTVGTSLYLRIPTSESQNERITEVLDVSAVSGSHTLYMRNITNTAGGLDYTTEHIIHSITLVYG